MIESKIISGEKESSKKEKRAGKKSSKSSSKKNEKKGDLASAPFEYNSLTFRGVPVPMSHQILLGKTAYDHPYPNCKASEPCRSTDPYEYACERDIFLQSDIVATKFPMKSVPGMTRKIRRQLRKNDIKYARDLYTQYLQFNYSADRFKQWLLETIKPDPKASDPTCKIEDISNALRDYSFNKLTPVEQFVASVWGLPYRHTKRTKSS